MSSAAIIALTDPRRPDAGMKRFKIHDDKFSDVLSKYYRRKIAGIFDEADKVYYPLGFIKLDSAYFSSRQRLSVVSAIDSDEYINTELGSSPVKKSKSSKDAAYINKAKQVYFTLCKDDGGISRDSMVKLLTVAFEFLFKVLGENREVCTPEDLAISATTDCFEYIGASYDQLNMAQFLSWYQAPQDIMNHELRSLMSQAIEIYLNPPPINNIVDSNGSENDESNDSYKDQRISNDDGGDNVDRAGVEEFEEIPLEAAIMEIKRFTGLYKYRVTDIIRFFLSQCDASNCLDRESFSILFQHLCGNEDKISDDIDNFIDILFSVFDIDNNEFVNLVDFGNCLPLFCSGTPVEMSEVAFQLADHDQDGTLSPRELFLYLRSTTQFLCQLSSEISQVYDNQSPDEIAWIITVAAFAWIGKGIDASDFSYDHSLNTTTGSHCQERMTFKEFQNWYFYGNGLHTPTWRETDLPSNSDENYDDYEDEEQVEDPESPYKLDEEANMHILAAKEILPLKLYSAVILSNFFCTLADGEGLLSESNFYHAFDKLMKTSRSPRSFIHNNARNHLAVDSAVAKIYRTYDPHSSGFVNVRDVLYGLLIFSGDYDISRAGAALNALEWTLRESGDIANDGNMEYVLENDMAACISSILKLVFTFNVAHDGDKKNNITAEYLAAHLTVEAYYRSNAKMVSGDQYAIDPRVFRDWVAVVYNIIDADSFSTLSEDNHDEFLKAVIEMSMSFNKQLYEQPKDNSEYDYYEERDDNGDDDEGENSYAPTDQSLAGDNISLTSGQSGNSISNNIMEEIDNAMALLGLSSMAAEDLMEVLGESSHSGAITLPELQQCIEYTTAMASLDKNYHYRTRGLVNDIFSCFDVRNSGTISFAEIVCGLSVLTNSPTGDKVAVSFLVLDTNSSGTISVASVEVFIRSVLKVLVLCSPTARGQLMRNCNASDRYPSVLVVNSSGDAGSYLDETEMENIITVVEHVAKDVLGLCLNSGLLKDVGDEYESVDIHLMCKVVGEFCDMQQTIADNFYV